MRQTSAQCSKEHVTACLARLQAVVRTSFRSEDAARATFAAYIDELTHYSPQAVTAGCLQWGRQKPNWPSLAELIGFIEVNDRARGLPNPSAPETLLARIKRVAGYDAAWVRERHDLLMAEVFADHCEGALSDDALARRLADIAGGRFVRRDDRPQLTDAQRLASWETNDRLGHELAANHQRYFLGAALAGIFSRFREKRFADHPELAGRYYGSPA